MPTASANHTGFDSRALFCLTNAHAAIANPFRTFRSFQMMLTVQVAGHVEAADSLHFGPKCSPRLTESSR